MGQRNSESTSDRRLCKSVLATWLIFHSRGKRSGWDSGRRKESAEASARKNKRNEPNNKETVNQLLVEGDVNLCK